MEIKPLREVLQYIEKTHTVDFELAGHKFERPPDVYQQADHEDQCPIFILTILGGVPISLQILNWLNCLIKSMLIPNFKLVELFDKKYLDGYYIQYFGVCFNCLVRGS